MPGSVYASAISGTITTATFPLVTGTSAGMVPMIGTATTAYLKGDLTWSTIAGGGDMLASTYDPDVDGKIAEAQLSLNYATHTNALDHVNTLDHNGSAQDSTIAGKQATLVSATNIKTINSSSILGAGDLVVSGSLPELVVTKMIPTANQTISDGYSAYISRRYTLAGTLSLTIAGTGIMTIE
uniref:Putative tail protein n=1 Tax=viral metagenome TaxID=1070528 RepID=A0A6M3JAC8_9ZZZZ